jgi:hypothetical protein
MFAIPHPINADQYLRNHAAETNRIVLRNSQRKSARRSNPLRDWKRRSAAS